MTRSKTASLLVAAVAVATTTLAMGQAAAGPIKGQAGAGPIKGQAVAGATCAALPGLRIPASAIHLPTGGAEVTATSTKMSSGVEYCEVSVSVHPVDRSAPDIGIMAALPTMWNGESMMFGGGGHDGSIPNVAGSVPFGGGTTPLARGMVTYGSDSGHKNASTSLPTLDGSFGANDEALRNFAGDALKKTHDSVSFLIPRYYDGRVPAHSYFAGGSSGGREALAVAQKWPADFDGVISIYPAFNAATLDLYFGFLVRELAKPGAFPNASQQKLLYQSVIQACDTLDGVTDGVISNPTACHYNPAVLRCPGGVDLGTGCLSDAQIRAVTLISQPWALGYRTASGETGYPGFPLLSGADMTPALLGFGTQAPANPMPRTAAYGAQFWEQWVRYFVTRDPSYNSLSLDPNAPGIWRKRIDELTALQDDNDPNLSAFAARGGKLLIAHGTADELVSYRSTVDYYQRVQKAMGAAETRNFSRLYLVPGANHANVGGAFTAAWDSLSALDNWVNKGVPPREQVVTDTKAPTQRTRPLCEFTAWPRYNGSGDVNQASSFTCVPLSRGAGTESGAGQVIPLGRPETGAGGASHSRNNTLIGLGVLALVGAGVTIIPDTRRRRLPSQGPGGRHQAGR